MPEDPLAFALQSKQEAQAARTMADRAGERASQRRAGSLQKIARSQELLAGYAMRRLGERQSHRHGVPRRPAR
jgi:hypothetical protein